MASQDTVLGYSVVILHSGYTKQNKPAKEMKSNCSCTLIRGRKNIIVDTMTAWDKDIIIDSLQKYNLTPDMIDYVICTHGHSDHIGNNNLFLKATHFVGTSVSYKDTYYMEKFQNGQSYHLDGGIEIIPTPGHTLSDISVVIKTMHQGVYTLAGDLFECGDDIDNPSIWMNAGSESPEMQKQSRFNIAKISDWIVPGHGVPFVCTPTIRKKLLHQLHSL